MPKRKKTVRVKRRRTVKVIEVEEPPKPLEPVENPRVLQLKKEIKHLTLLAATDAGSQMLLGQKKTELVALQT